MIPLNYISLAVGAITGGLTVFGLGTVYNKLIDNPHVRNLAIAEAEAAAAKRTVEAINKVQDDADKARAMRAYCVSAGKLYDFGTNQCRE